MMTTKNIADFYPLSPMQQGMLFHSLYAPSAGMYVEQLSVTLQGDLNISAFKATWRKIIERHPILRTSFAWEGIKEPIQVVHRNVELPLEELDWRGIKSRADQESALEDYLREQRTRGFDLTKAPLMRLALIQIDEDAPRKDRDQYYFVWIHHHILLDGWSVPILLQEMFAFYSAAVMGVDVQIKPPRPFRDYIAWLKKRDISESEKFWRQELAGFTAPTSLMVSNPIRMRSAHRADLTEIVSKIPDDQPTEQISTEALYTLEQDVEFGELEDTLAREVSTALSSLSRQNQITLNTIIQGAWALLLSRYSGEPDVVFGATVSGRPPDLPGSDEMVGLFINTLPVRVMLPVKTSVLAYLKNLQLKQANLHQFEFTPLVQIQNWSQVPRGMPLFESILVFENFPIETAVPEQTGNVQVKGGGSASRTNYPLTLVALPGEEILLKIDYNCDLFDHETIQRMMGHLKTLLQNFVMQPDKELEAIPMLSSAERERMLYAWNEFDIRFPATRRIHEWVEQQVNTTPDAVAVNIPETESHPGASLTYRELNNKANQLAHFLRKRGVGVDVMVGLYAERSLEMVIGILGILKAGGAYVPMDPAYPAERLNFIVEDSRAPVLLTQERLLDNLKSLETPATQIFSLDADWGIIQQESTDASGLPGTVYRPNSYEAERDMSSTSQPATVGSHNLAYVIYTSGSTGKPKGVLVTHANVVRLFEATDDWYRFNEQDVWTLFHSYAFDFSVWEIWGALFYGGRLVVVPYTISRSPEAFYQLLCNERVTVLNQTPSAFRQLIRAEESLEMTVYRPNSCEELSLRYVIFGGEALELESLRPWFERHGDQKPQLVNMYGITETTVHVTYRPLTMRDVESGSGSVIGRPIPDLQIYILDPALEPTPIGVPGEIFVGGAGVARGYLNRPELTAQRFINDPFSERSYELTRKNRAGPGWDNATSVQDLPDNKTGQDNRLYRSGDLARYLPDGDIEYLGRMDHQVKIRGFRIELGEIETLITQYPDVRETIVLVREDERGLKRLIAYLVPASATPPTPGTSTRINVKELRSYLERKLPDYMIPAAFVIMEQLPLTAHGKVDRRALPLPDQERPELESEYVAPSTSEEKELANIFAQVLGIDRVGVHDSFFELGGDSILSLQVVAMAKQAGLNLTPRLLFQFPDIANLARAATSAAPDRPAAGIEAEQSMITGSTPLTPIQHWFFEHHPHAPHHFNTSMMLEVSKTVKPDILRQTILYLIQHHDALRLTFRPLKDDLWDAVVTDMPDDNLFSMHDLSQISQGKQRHAIEELANQLQGSFDLARGPLVRFAYIDLGPNNHARLLIIFHHLVTDGVSWRIFLGDFARVFTQLAAGAPADLPPKTTSYRQWADLLVDYARSDEISKEVEYWTSLIPSQSDLGMLGKHQPETGGMSSATATKFNMPSLRVDFEGGANTYGSTESLTLSLSVDDTNRLLRGKLGHRAGSTVYRPNSEGSHKSSTTSQRMDQDGSIAPESSATNLTNQAFQVNALLLTALVNTLEELTGSRRLMVEMEGHGREEIFPGIDLSRTIGWFTSIYPLFLDLETISDRTQQVERVREQLRSIPEHGFGYGVLRYLSPYSQTLKSQPAPLVNFNYLGQFDRLPDTVYQPEKAAKYNHEHQEMNPPGQTIDFPVRIAPESVGIEQDPNGLRSAQLYWVGIISGGELSVRWLYSKELHKKSTIQKIAKRYIKELKLLID